MSCVQRRSVMLKAAGPAGLRRRRTSAPVGSAEVVITLGVCGVHHAGLSTNRHNESSDVASLAADHPVLAAPRPITGLHRPDTLGLMFQGLWGCFVHLVRKPVHGRIGGS